MGNSARSGERESTVFAVSIEEGHVSNKNKNSRVRGDHAGARGGAKPAENLSGSLGGQVRAARVAAGMTQEALAEVLGCTSATVSNIERGRYAPSMKVLWGLQETLGIAVVPPANRSDGDGNAFRNELYAHISAVLRRLSDKDLALAKALIDVMARSGG